jgi:hypothetical protein
MMNTSIQTENTVLYFVKDKMLKQALEEAACRNDSNLIKISKVSDIYAIPCYCMVVEIDIASDEMIEAFIESAEDIMPITIGKRCLPHNRRLEKKLIHYISTPTQEELCTAITKAKITVSKHRKRAGAVKSKIYRTILLYNQALTGMIDIDKFCLEHMVTERTIRNDIRILKDLFPEINFFTNRK